ncbi:MAG: cyclic nucleotide-gated ion channel, partial [Stellaceae bacterium]
MTRRWLYRLMDPAARDAASRAFRLVHHAMVALGISIMLAVTVTGIRNEYGPVLEAGFLVIAAFFVGEFVLRLIAAPEAPGGEHRGPMRARLAWLFSLGGVLDLLGALPGLIDLDLTHDARLFAFVWIFKYVRYSPGLVSIGRVITQARRALLSVLLGFVIVLLAAASLAYLFERNANPAGFGSIPKALWWAIVTLTTTGYGDVVPQTLPGRMLSGVVMVSGILVFALWAGILATGYAEETRRREFLRTWDLVAKVPFFHNLGASVIAEVARLLSPREYPIGAVIVRRGEPGDCMYFVVEGEVVVQIQPEPIFLGPGQFFGELALLSGDPRNATIVASSACVLLTLDIVDFHELRGRQPELARAIHEEADRRRGVARPQPVPLVVEAG